MNNQQTSETLTPEDHADLLEAEFEEVFGRPPDAYDRRLGLARAIEFQRELAGFRAARH